MPSFRAAARFLFIGPGGWRAGWRFLLFFVIAFVSVKAAFWGITTATGYVEQAGWTAPGLLLDGAVTIAAVLVATAAMARLERARWSDYALAPLSLRRFGAGLAWGFALSTVALLLVVATGGATIHGFAAPAAGLAGPVLLWAVVMLLLGLAEELLYRAYSLLTFARAMGFWPGAALSTALFAAAHLSKPHETALDILSVVLLGLFWCFTVRRTGTIWFAAGFHAMANFADLVLYAAPNTGNGGRALDGHLLDVVYGGPAWLTGGQCGLEASPFVLAITLGMFVAFARLHPAPPEAAPMVGGAMTEAR